MIESTATDTQAHADALRAQLTALRLAGAPYRERVAVSNALRAEEQVAGPPVRMVAPPARCCDRGHVSYGCTCSYVVRCPEHGERHHGTHD